MVITIVIGSHTLFGGAKILAPTTITGTRGTLAVFVLFFIGLWIDVLRTTSSPIE